MATKKAAAPKKTAAKKKVATKKPAAKKAAAPKKTAAKKSAPAKEDTSNKAGSKLRINPKTGLPVAYTRKSDEDITHLCPSYVTDTQEASIRALCSKGSFSGGVRAMGRKLELKGF